MNKFTKANDSKSGAKETTKTKSNSKPKDKKRVPYPIDYTQDHP
jgi:hypothetical protein